jgi:hypothetical protein
MSGGECRAIRAPATPSAVHPPKRLRLPRTTARSSSSLTGFAWRSAPAASCSRDRADAVLRDQGREGTPEPGEDYRSCNDRGYHTMVNLVYQRVNNITLGMYDAAISTPSDVAAVHQQRYGEDDPCR